MSILCSFEMTKCDRQLWQSHFLVLVLAASLIRSYIKITLTGNNFFLDFPCIEYAGITSVKYYIKYSTFNWKDYSVKTTNNKDISYIMCASFITFVWYKPCDSSSFLNRIGILHLVSLCSHSGSKIKSSKKMLYC